MKYWVGIDLGSTTTKAVMIGAESEILGRGITNSRSNYEVACDVALGDALVNARFALIERGLEVEGVGDDERQRLLTRLELKFREQQYRAQLATFVEVVRRNLSMRLTMSPATGSGGGGQAEADPKPVVESVLARMESETTELYGEDANRKSDFFRDLAGSRFMALAEEAASDGAVKFDTLAGVFDKAILDVENRPARQGDFHELAEAALTALDDRPPTLERVVRQVTEVALESAGGIGTGYGRRTLPFPKEDIRSEILCHGLGAHAMFPGTRTLLDIGGQDTKAIQIDENGIVTSFQMNDRCAAGCGRYLGYIADEMNMGVHELGPMACKSSRPTRINSTCTVFAGAELRERLSFGEKREDILAGLHRAIILRAMSLLARSGGVADEFTFTGGVARNGAAVSALRELVHENYGEVTINVSADSIYTGGLGAARFALAASRGSEPVDEPLEAATAREAS